MPELPSTLKIIVVVLFAYIALVAIVFLLQRRMLYFPSSVLPPETVAHTRGLTSWPNSGQTYRGFVAVDSSQDVKGTIIVFHGNAGQAIDRNYYGGALTPLGYRVLLAEYPGYGARVGRPSEAAFITDAKETVELAHQAYGDPIILWGESLGSGVATALAADTTVPVTAVVLVTPWDSLPRLAQTIYWFFPARWLVLDRYDNVRNLQSFAGPVAVVVAEQDEIIPTRHSMRLFKSIPGSKRLWVLENAGHNSWPVQPDAGWWREVTAFISEGLSP